jgi:hypothetical protein
VQAQWNPGTKQRWLKYWNRPPSSDPVLPGVTNEKGLFRAGHGRTWIDYHGREGRLDRGPLNCVYLFANNPGSIDEYIRLQIWRFVSMTIDKQKSFQLVWQRRVQLFPVALSPFCPKQRSPQFVVRFFFFAKRLLQALAK